LSGVLAAVILDGQHRVRNDLVTVNLGGQGGNEHGTLLLHSNINDWEVDLGWHLLGNGLGWNIAVLAISIRVLGSNHQLWQSTNILDDICLVA